MPPSIPVHGLDALHPVIPSTVEQGKGTCLKTDGAAEPAQGPPHPAQHQRATA